MASKARILVVEDEEVMCEALATALAGDGYQVRTTRDGRQVPDLLGTFRPDLVVLDWMLPGRDGIELSADIRRSTDAAIVMLTARDSVPDRLRGFDSGVDDYVVKPFALAELLARVRAVLRRLGRIPSTIEIGDLLVDEDAGVAVRAGSPLDLTATELRLLAYLAANRGRTLTKTQILTQVWGYDDYDPNLVEVHVSALRRKTEVHGPRLLHTVRGLGYMLRA
ncbi:MAG: response regulator transcription factor [Haloechinothrix sp.]